LNATRSHKPRSLALAGLLLLAGCLPPPAAPESFGPVKSWVLTAERADIHSSGRFGHEQVRIEKGSLSGPRVRLDWYDHEGHPALRGNVKDRPVDIDYKDNQLSGATNRGLINLRFMRDEQGVRVGGMFGGDRVDLVIGPKIIEGWIPGCSCKLEPQGNQYVGSRTCASRAEPFSVEISENLGDRPAINLAVALIVLIGTS
jgi:hypothetical protein